MMQRKQQKLDRLESIRDTAVWSITNKVPKGTINFAISEPTFPMPGAIRNAVQEIVLSEDLSYSPVEGLEELRDMVASRFQYSYKAEGVTISAGASEALYSIMASLSCSGDTILLPSVGNPSYRAVAELLGLQVQTYPIHFGQSLQFRTEEIEALLSADIRIILVNTPLDPTGQVFTHEEMTKLANSCAEFGIYLLVDESYHEIYFDHRVQNLSGYGENVIFFSSLSKLFSMAGWRIGWILSHPTILRRINAFRKFMITCAPTISQRMAIRLFKGTGRESRDKILSILDNRRKLMIETMRQKGLNAFQEPVAGYYLFFNYQAHLQNSLSSSAFAARLSGDYNVAVMPGALFGKDGEGFIRISFAADEKSIQDGIQKIKEIIDELQL
jgi:aspartate/methionine/tyrosine aminotransferase